MHAPGGVAAFDIEKVFHNWLKILLLLQTLMYMCVNPVSQLKPIIATLGLRAQNSFFFKMGQTQV